MAFIDIHDIGQIGTIFGIVAVLVSGYFQFRSYKKSQREEQEKSRLAITAEINQRAGDLMEKVEYKLELIKTASQISKYDLDLIRKELDDLKIFVKKMDDEGTVEWRKVKPFIIDKVERLEKRVEDLERHMPDG